jgi:hypothetical protein
MSPSAPSVDHNQFSKPTMEAEMSSGEGPRPMLVAKVTVGPLPTIESFLCEHHGDLILPHYVYETVAFKGSIHHFQYRTLPYSYREMVAIF